MFVCQSDLVTEKIPEAITNSGADGGTQLAIYLLFAGLLAVVGALIWLERSRAKTNDERMKEYKLERDEEKKQRKEERDKFEAKEEELNRKKEEFAKDVRDGMAEIAKGIHKMDKGLQRLEIITTDQDEKIKELNSGQSDIKDSLNSVKEYGEETRRMVQRLEKDKAT